jgi:hypothetical protein
VIDYSNDSSYTDALGHSTHSGSEALSPSM